MNDWMHPTTLFTLVWIVSLVVFATLVILGDRGEK